MRRAERLFRIVQHLRAAGRPVTAEALADRLEVSKRTVYRDIAHLQGSGLPLDGEAGIGYLLRPGFDLPPMTFTTEQAEALVLGARLVSAVADAGLAAAGREALDKIAAVMPADQSRTLEAPLFAFLREPAEQRWLALLRRAAREHRKVRMRYESIAGKASARTVRPLALVCFGRVWLLTAWCELRNDFRSFRADLVVEAELGDRFEDEPGRTLADYLAACGLEGEVPARGNGQITAG